MADGDLRGAGGRPQPERSEGGGAKSHPLRHFIRQGARMVNNQVQFAVVREDPSIEFALVKTVHARKALLIASGGCVALSLKARFPDLQITLVDPNAAQLNLIEKKIQQLKHPQKNFKQIFNIGTPDPIGLNARGNFESLFRGLREFIFDLIWPYSKFYEFFQEPFLKNNQYFARSLFSSKYWPVAFNMFFCDSFLNAIFGKKATQHATKGSYPLYFQKIFEKGLKAKSADKNYFLHHIFLGHYLDRRECLPLYLTNSILNFDFQFIHGTLEGVPDIERFDLISISNIMDWMSNTEIKSLSNLLRSKAKRGSALVFRQLNNFSNLNLFYEPEFKFDGPFGKRLLSQDRSLFYSKIGVGFHE